MGVLRIDHAGEGECAEERGNEGKGKGVHVDFVEEEAEEVFLLLVK